MTATAGTQAAVTTAAVTGAGRAWRADVTALAVLGVLVVLAPLVLPGQWVTLGVFAGVYAFAAVGLSLLMGLAGQVSLGHAGFFAVGAYAQALLTTRYGWPMAAALVVAVALTCVVALLVGLPLLRLRGHYLALATLGFGIIVTVVANESSYLGGTSGVFGILKPEFNHRVYDSSAEYFWLVWPLVAVVALLARNVVESRVGRALAAVNDSEVAAETLGVDTFRLRLQVFVVSAGLAAVGGAFYAHWVGVVNPASAAFQLSVMFLLMAVLGGLSSVWGAVAGAVAVQVLEHVMRDLVGALVPGASGEYQLIGFGVVLTAVVILLPGGLADAYRRVSARLSRAAPPSAPDPATRGTAAPAPTHDVPPRGTTLLEVRDVTRRFGGVVAVDGVTLEVRAGEICALIGPNGAGKTTLFDIATGVLAPTGGSVHMAGHRVDGRRPHVVARAGAARTFQNLRIFGSMTVTGNVRVGLHQRSRGGLLAGALVLPARTEERRVEHEARTLVDLLGLGDVADRAAGDLPFGRQRLVEVARALASGPSLLLADEPMAGLSASERAALADLLRALRDAGMAVLLVEHDVDAVMALADRVAVLDDGRLIALGPPEQVRTEPAVVEAYLGMGDANEGGR